MRELPFYTNWSYAHPRAIELAAEVASLAPGDLNRVFFCSGGSEAVESAWKLARQYYLARGEKQILGLVTPGARAGAQEPEVAHDAIAAAAHAGARRYKAIARHIAYHGTTMGALSINGIPALRTPFEPLVSEVRHVSNTNRYHRPPRRLRRSSRGSSSTSWSRRSWRWGPTPCASCTWSRCRTRAAASRRRSATGRACARSAIATTSCSRPTRSSPPSAASATGSARSATTSSRTSSRWRRGSRRPMPRSAESSRPTRSWSRSWVRPRCSRTGSRSAAIRS